MMKKKLAAFLYLQEDYDSERTVEDINASVDKFVKAFSSLKIKLSAISKNEDLHCPKYIQSIFYDVAKYFYGESRDEIREFFTHVYIFVMHSRNGPRLGEFVSIMGINEFIYFANERVNNPIMLTLE